MEKLLPRHYISRSLGRKNYNREGEFAFFTILFDAIYLWRRGRVTRRARYASKDTGVACFMIFFEEIYTQKNRAIF